MNATIEPHGTVIYARLVLRLVYIDEAVVGVDFVRIHGGCLEVRARRGPAVFCRNQLRLFGSIGKYFSLRCQIQVRVARVFLYFFPCFCLLTATHHRMRGQATPHSHCFLDLGLRSFLLSG